MNIDCPICAALTAEPCQLPLPQLTAVAAAETRTLPDGSAQIAQQRFVCCCGARWLQIDAVHQPFVHWVRCDD